MKLSIIVPIYNVEKYLPQCIDSILNQDYVDFELILVNDGSPDDSLSICRQYAVLQIKVNRFCRKSPKKYSADSRVKMRTANRTPSKIGGSQMTK